MFLHNSSGHTIAELRFIAGSQAGRRETDNSPAASELFRSLRSIPREYLKVDIRYFNIGHDEFVPLTINQGMKMDIQSALSDHDEQASAEAGREPKVEKMIFVAPISDTSPDDGVLSYSTVENLFDLDKVPERSVVRFRPDQMEMLKCVCDNATLFGMELRAMTGIPETDYSSDFDSVTWSLDRVAYLPFLSELRLAAEMDDQMKAIDETAHDRERASYVRKSGKIKEHANFEVHDPESSSLSTDDSAIE